ncbi:putative subtilisin [Ilyonectria robusta]
MKILRLLPIKLGQLHLVLPRGRPALPRVEHGLLRPVPLIVEPQELHVGKLPNAVGKHAFILDLELRVGAGPRLVPESGLALRDIRHIGVARRTGPAASFLGLCASISACCRHADDHVERLAEVAPAQIVEHALALEGRGHILFVGPQEDLSLHVQGIDRRAAGVLAVCVRRNAGANEGGKLGHGTRQGAVLLVQFRPEVEFHNVGHVLPVIWVNCGDLLPVEEALEVLRFRQDGAEPCDGVWGDGEPQDKPFHVADGLAGRLGHCANTQRRRGRG